MARVAPERQVSRLSATNIQGDNWGGYHMVKKWNTKMFSEYVNEFYEGEFKVVGEYKNNATPIKMYHKKCKRNFMIRPGNFKTRGTCSLCHGKFRKTTVQFKSEVKEKVGSEYFVLGNYKNAKTKIKMIHNICDKEFYVTPDDFLNGGNRCPHCAANKKITTREFESIVNQLDSDYILLGEVINTKTPVKFKHNKCGTIFNKMPELFKIGSRCPKCGLESRSKENHYRYNPELTDEERESRDMFNGEIKKWRVKIFERDNYTCNKCGNFGKRLNAHHLFSWDVHKEKRFNLENGITLCDACHLSFHKHFGYGNNTLEQYIEYKKIPR